MMSLKQITTNLNGKKWISDLFYEKSKNKSLAKNAGDIPQEWITIHFKTYPRLPRIQMKKLRTAKMKTLFERRSTRLFTGEKIMFKTLSTLLYNSAGIIKKNEDINYSRRSYPSAGARYPLETYIVALNIEGLEEGLYHYNIKDNLLEILLLEKMEKHVLDFTGGENWLLNSNFIIIITGVPDRLRVKYGERGFRYMLIESGHLAQNLCMLTTTEGLGCCTLGGFIESKVISLLDIGNVNEYPLYMVGIGEVKK